MAAINPIKSDFKISTLYDVKGKIALVTGGGGAGLGTSEHWWVDPATQGSADLLNAFRGSEYRSGSSFIRYGQRIGSEWGKGHHRQ
jgi:hypothetical protein